MTHRQLDGRRAVITGASRGIGREMALLFAEEGAHVAVVARSGDLLAALADEISGLGGTCTTITADMTDPEAAARIVEESLATMGGIDILVNNAGGNSFMSPLQTMRLSGWRKTMDLNVDATVRLIQCALPALVDSDHASVVNVASVAGLRSAPLMSHYAAAKAALISLTRSLAVEVAPQGIRVNSLVPGWIETDLTDFLRTDDAIEESVLGRVPMARWGRPREIAQAALFLASDASSFMTGQELVVDGGLTAQP